MKTEIFGTFGPACAEESMLQEMITAGMTGMRLNLSHTMLAESADYIMRYQNAAEICGVKPQILIDMKGPELRVGKLWEPVWLHELTELSLYTQEVYDKLTVVSPYSNEKDEKLPALSPYIPVPHEVLEMLEVGDELLLDDGKLLVRVVRINEGNWMMQEPIEKTGQKNPKITKSAIVEVRRGGLLTSGKSIKIRDKIVNLPPLTNHDVENIKVAKAYGVTALMQPFVLHGEDLRQVRAVLKEHDAEDIQIFAKIENRMGVEKITDILPEADVIVIARGDLGNDMPLWELPKVQKQLEAACKKAGKPYIVVTQMLASMEEHPVPTRAEVSDIFHAVYHGAWGVMVTGETAVGKYPVEAICYLVNTAREAEHCLENK